MGMREQSVITTTAADALLATIASRGGRVSLLKAKLGIAQHSQAESDLEHFPLALFTAALESAASDSGDSLLGLKLGRAFRLEGFGPIATLSLTAASLGDALSKFVRCSSLLQSNSSFDLSVSGDLARLSYAIVDPSVKLRRQDAYFTIAVQDALLSRMLGGKVSPSSVDFQHMPDTDLADYRDHFGCPVRFGRQLNAITFPASWLDSKVRQTDPGLHRRIEADLIDTARTSERRFDLTRAIESWMVSALSAAGGIDVEHAASDFGMSLRSFQRRLSESSINFLDIRNRVRCQVAQDLLGATTMPITSIAHYLGYSETSAFSRIFKQQTDLSPSQFRLRNALRSDPAAPLP